MNKLLFIFFIIGTLYSCSDIRKKYYNSGELKSEITYDNDSIYHIIDYYKNGNILSQGNYINNVKCGFWREWYPDDSIKWEGKYIEGERQIEVFQKTPKILFRDVSEYFIVGKTYSFRIRVQGLHPSDMLIACTNGKVELDTNDDLFDFKFTPNKSGNLKLLVYPGIMDVEYFVGELVFNIE